MAVQLSRSRSRRGNAEINVTPFVDVVPVLLIIFMVTAPLMLQGMDVNLPETTTQPIRMPTAPPCADGDERRKVFARAQGNRR